MSRIMKVSLVAGQECLMSCHGVVRISLLDGVVEVAGVLLQPSVEVVVKLSAVDNRRLSAYTFEGGTFSVTSSAAIDIVKCSTDAGALMTFVRSALAPLRTSRVAVVGAAGSGKTLTAHSICNMLARSGSQRVFLADLSPASNSVVCPGCISAVHVSAAHPLIAGACSVPDEVGVSFFTGALAPVSSVPLFVHHVSQLQECMQSLMKQVASPRESIHAVYDVGAPEEGVPLDAYLRRVLEVIRPTHILVITNKKTDAVETSRGVSLWYVNLQEDVQRLLTDCEYRVVHHVPHAVLATGSSAAGDGAAKGSKVAITVAEGQQSSSLLVQQLLVDEYFAGTVDRPLGTTKVVFKLSALRFYIIAPPSTTGDLPKPQRITPTAEDIAMTVCAISYASAEAELPFANILGLIFIVSIDQLHDEITAVLPSGECEIPRPLVLVPTKGKLKLTHAIVTSCS
jgi:hypothetical protein